MHLLVKKMNFDVIKIQGVAIKTLSLCSFSNMRYQISHTVVAKN